MRVASGESAAMKVTPEPATLASGHVRLESLAETHIDSLARTMPDGWLRDTVLFSIVAAEWPAVRARLDGFSELK